MGKRTRWNQVVNEIDQLSEKGQYTEAVEIAREALVRAARTLKELKKRTRVFEIERIPWYETSDKIECLSREGKYLEAVQTAKEDLLRAELTFGPKCPYVGWQLGRLVELLVRTAEASSPPVSEQEAAIAA